MFEQQLEVPVEPFSAGDDKTPGPSPIRSPHDGHALVPSLAGQMPDTAVEYVQPQSRKKILRRRRSPKVSQGPRVCVKIPQPEIGSPGYSSSTSHSWEDSPTNKAANKHVGTSVEKSQLRWRESHETAVIGPQAWTNRDSRKKQPHDHTSLSPSAALSNAAFDLEQDEAPSNNRQNDAPRSNRVCPIKETDLFTVPPQTNRPASAPPRRSGEPKIIASGGDWKDFLLPKHRYVVSHCHEPPRGVSNRPSSAQLRRHSVRNQAMHIAASKAGPIARTPPHTLPREKAKTWWKQSQELSLSTPVYDAVGIAEYHGRSWSRRPGSAWKTTSQRNAQTRPSYDDPSGLLQVVAARGVEIPLVPRPGTAAAVESGCLTVEISLRSRPSSPAAVSPPNGGEGEVLDERVVFSEMCTNSGSSDWGNNEEDSYEDAKIPTFGTFISAAISTSKHGNSNETSQATGGLGSDLGPQQGAGTASSNPASKAATAQDLTTFITQARPPQTEQDHSSPLAKHEKLRTRPQSAPPSSSQRRGGGQQQPQTREGGLIREGGPAAAAATREAGAVTADKTLGLGGKGVGAELEQREALDGARQRAQAAAWSIQEGRVCPGMDSNTEVRKVARRMQELQGELEAWREFDWRRFGVRRSDRLAASRLEWWIKTAHTQASKAGHSSYSHARTHALAQSRPHAKSSSPSDSLSLAPAQSHSHPHSKPASSPAAHAHAHARARSNAVPGALTNASTSFKAHACSGINKSAAGGEGGGGSGPGAVHALFLHPSSSTSSTLKSVAHRPASASAAVSGGGRGGDWQWRG